MKKMRVIRRRKVATPDHWGVQQLDGYTDGKPSWRLATRQSFWSKDAALAYVAEIARDQQKRSA